MPPAPYAAAAPDATGRLGSARTLLRPALSKHAKAVQEARVAKLCEGVRPRKEEDAAFFVPDYIDELLEELRDPQFEPRERPTPTPPPTRTPRGAGGRWTDFNLTATPTAALTLPSPAATLLPVATPRSSTDSAMAEAATLRPGELMLALPSHGAAGVAAEHLGAFGGEVSPTSPFSPTSTSAAAAQAALAAAAAKEEAARLGATSPQPPTSPVVDMIPQHYPSDLLWQRPSRVVPASQVRFVSTRRGGAPAAIRWELASKVCQDPVRPTGPLAGITGGESGPMIQGCPVVPLASPWLNEEGEEEDVPRPVTPGCVGSFLRRQTGVDAGLREALARRSTTPRATTTAITFRLVGDDPAADEAPVFRHSITSREPLAATAQRRSPRERATTTPLMSPLPSFRTGLSGYSDAAGTGPGTFMTAAPVPEEGCLEEALQAEEMRTEARRALLVLSPESMYQDTDDDGLSGRVPSPSGMDFEGEFALRVITAPITPRRPLPRSTTGAAGGAAIARAAGEKAEHLRILRDRAQAREEPWVASKFDALAVSEMNVQRTGSRRRRRHGRGASQHRTSSGSPPPPGVAADVEAQRGSSPGRPEAPAFADSQLVAHEELVAMPGRRELVQIEAPGSAAGSRTLAPRRSSTMPSQRDTLSLFGGATPLPRAGELAAALARAPAVQDVWPRHAAASPGPHSSRSASRASQASPLPFWPPRSVTPSRFAILGVAERPPSRATAATPPLEDALDWRTYTKTVLPPMDDPVTPSAHPGQSRPSSAIGEPGSPSPTTPGRLLSRDPFGIGAFVAAAAAATLERGDAPRAASDFGRRLSFTRGRSRIDEPVARNLCTSPDLVWPEPEEGEHPTGPWASWRTTPGEREEAAEVLRDNGPAASAEVPAPRLDQALR